MLLLTSNGLSSPALVQAMETQAAGLKRAVIVTTASMEHKEKDKNVPRLRAELEQLGLTVELFDFDEQDARQLFAYDVIELLGGNPFYLLKALKRTGGGEVLQTLAREKLVIGVSAGSLACQKNIELIAQYSPELNEAVGLADLTGLGLVEFEILPHYHRFLGLFDRFEEQAQAHEAATGCWLYRLDDGQAILVQGKKHTLLG